MGKRDANVMHCISCELSCQVFPQKSVRLQYCGNANFILWPERNSYLKTGLLESYLLHSKIITLNGFVFVDFSVSNLRYFVGQEWIDRLTETGMKIIIIADRVLAPLANYWLKKWRGVQGIIYADDSASHIHYKFERIFSGRFANITRGPTLNDSEFSLLALILSESGLRKAHRLNELNVSEIYVRKNRLERKLGCNINKLFSLISGTAKEYPPLG
ncbi:hypothetical protein [Trabulsiella odontotermitis]|uniref:hypothetical protein n=1 Tax=Trabulsiella odontotermitis TaxID=379893 RepID=UPI00092D03D1|nr:hypothetical protein [Trabulsiella odontotermitis]